MKFLAPSVALLLQSIVAYAEPVDAGPGLGYGIGGIMRELGPLLSRDGTITLPSSPGWDLLLERAASPRINPSYLAVVEVATENDVQQTIIYANRHGIPFLAVSGSHGWTSTLNEVNGGIQINMRKLNYTKVYSHGKTATAGGGVMQYEITSALFEQGKQAVTGICECVSTIGPLLGGGHSMLQGRHGFAADNLVSARLILADGAAVTVSAVENPDLFWAIRGAGHNFGIVTSFDLKVYNIPDEKWTIIALTITQDKLEAFFDTWNQMEVAHEDPGMLVLNGIIFRNNSLDLDHPVINLQLLYEGENTAADDYAAAFRTLDPVADLTVTDISWGSLFDIGGFGLESPVCRKNENILGYPNSFALWDASAMRKGFDLFSELTADETFSTSAWLLESYGRKGVEAVPVPDNAVAPEERLYHILTSPILWWAGDDERDRQKAATYGENMQKAVRGESSVPHSYVNYAVGHEELPEVYGREAARIAKLKSLKKTWDPHNRFGFYMPIM